MVDMVSELDGSLASDDHEVGSGHTPGNTKSIPTNSVIGLPV